MLENRQPKHYFVKHRDIFVFSAFTLPSKWRTLLCTVERSGLDPRRKKTVALSGFRIQPLPEARTLNNYSEIISFVKGELVKNGALNLKFSYWIWKCHGPGVGHFDKVSNKVYIPCLFINIIIPFLQKIGREPFGRNIYHYSFDNALHHPMFLCELGLWICNILYYS